MSKEIVGWYIGSQGYRVGTLTKENHMQYEHIRIAEKAIGGRLPKGAEIHHVNGNTSDNDTPYNLVICPSRAYHKLLHSRQRAKDACGNADWKPCAFCKEYDYPSRMAKHDIVRGGGQQRYCHSICRSEYRRSKKAVA